ALNAATPLLTRSRMSLGEGSSLRLSSLSTTTLIVVTRLVYSGGKSVGRQPSRSINPLNGSTPLKAVCKGRSTSARNVPIVCSVPCWSAMTQASRIISSARLAQVASGQRVDVVVVAVDLEVMEGIDELDHDVAAHRAELGRIDVIGAHH